MLVINFTHQLTVSRASSFLLEYPFEEGLLMWILVNIKLAFYYSFTYFNYIASEGVSPLAHFSSIFVRALAKMIDLSLPVGLNLRFKVTYRYL